LVLKDDGDALFGVWMGEEGVHPSHGKGYYGSGESFMWKYVEGKFEAFKWTGRNDYVALCEPEFISFGGGYVLHSFMSSAFPPFVLTNESCYLQGRPIWALP
jgi:hypothetical protein